MRCRNCRSELPSPTSYCLVCGERNAIGCGLYVGEDKVYLLFIGYLENETIPFRVYDEEESLRNLYEIIAERIHERRVEEVYISGKSPEMIERASELLRKYALTQLSISTTDPFSSPSEFERSLERHLKAVKELRKVFMRPEEKIQGAHSTIIGGREGMRYVRMIASSEYVKKVIPGVIEAKGSATGGGVRFKLTRCDERGNIRGLLIDGATVQEIHIVTTARNKEEGEEILRILRGILES